MKDVRKRFEQILKEFIVLYDAHAASDKQGKVDSLVLIQTALNNLLALNQYEMGKAQLEMSCDACMKDSEESES